jgi:hypothetical protein
MRTEAGFDAEPTLNSRDAELTLNSVSSAWIVRTANRRRVNQLTLNRTPNSREFTVTLYSRLSLRGGTAWEYSVEVDRNSRTTGSRALCRKAGPVAAAAGLTGN